MAPSAAVGGVLYDPIKVSRDTAGERNTLTTNKVER